MATTSFWEHPIDRLEEALSIRKQIAALQNKLGSLFGGNAPVYRAPRKGGKRRMSAAARARIAAAQRARWAKQKGTTTVEAFAALAAGKSPKRRGKRTMSPEARERIAAAQRARWAKRKGTAAASGAVQKSPAKRSGGKRKVSAQARAKMAEAARKRWAKVKKGG